MGPWAKVREGRNGEQDENKRRRGSKIISGQVGPAIHPLTMLVNPPPPSKFGPSQTQPVPG